MVVAICDDETRGPLDDLEPHAKLADVGGSHREIGDGTRTRDPHVHEKAIEGLLQEGVLAEGGLTAKASAAVGSGEQAGRGIESQMAKVSS
jgi:hypothetical protein